MITVHILCSDCPPPAATHGRSVFRHSPTALSIMRWSSLSHSSAIRRHRSSISLMLVLKTRSCSTSQTYSRWTGFRSGLLGGHKFNGMKYGVSTFNYPPLVNIDANVTSRFSQNRMSKIYRSKSITYSKSFFS